MVPTVPKVNVNFVLLESFGSIEKLGPHMSTDNKSQSKGCHFFRKK